MVNHILKYFFNDKPDYLFTKIFKLCFFTLIFTLIIAVTFTANSLAMDIPVYQPTAWYEWQSFWKQQERVYERQKGVHKGYVKLQDVANQDEFHSPVIRYSDSDSEDCTDN